MFKNIYFFLSDPKRLGLIIDVMAAGVTYENKTNTAVKLTGEASYQVQAALRANQISRVITSLDKADVSALYKYRNTKTLLAHIAIMTGNRSLLKKCLSLGLKGNEVDAKGMTILIQAIQSGKQDMVDIISSGRVRR